MAEYTDKVRTVVQIIQAHRRVSDEVAVPIAETILAWVADPTTWNDETFRRADAARRKAMH